MPVKISDNLKDAFINFEENIYIYNIIIFNTQNKHYIYSGNTGQIIEINPYIKEILMGESIDKDISKKLESCYPYIFSPSPIKQINLGYKEYEIEMHVNKNLKQMTLGVTNECNMRCKYCVYSGNFAHYRVHSSKTMSKEVAYKAANYFLNHISQNNEPKFFTFYGGEPLLNFDLITEIINYIKFKSDADIFFSITTNGTLIDEDKLEYLIKNKIFLMISLDGDQQTHDNNRRFINGKPTFEVVMRNLNKIKEMDNEYYRYYIIFSTTLTDGCDYKQLDRFFSDYQKTCKISGVLSYGSQNIKPVKDTSINMKYIIDKFVEGCRIHAYDNIDTCGPYIFALNVVGTVIKLLHKRNVTDQYISDEEYLFKNHCIPGSTKIFVSPEGYFYPCEKLDSHEHLIIGDTDNGVNLAKVIKLLQEFILLKREFCKDCFLLDICNLCFQSASNGREWDKEKFGLFCRYAKNDFKNGLVIYSTILENDENACEFLLKN